MSRESFQETRSLKSLKGRENAEGRVRADSSLRFGVSVQEMGYCERESYDVVPRTSSKGLDSRVVLSTEAWSRGLE